jgi:putative acetyltransferase
MTATQSESLIRDFQPADAPAFRAINEEWITRHFVLEPKDSYNLNRPQETVLDPGGRIFLAFDPAVDLNQAIGCCALLYMSPGVYEVSKMGVTQSAQGRGLGRKLLAHTIEQARLLGATRLYLETNHLLLPAIHLYEALGFSRVPPERHVPSPYARADVAMELFLNPAPARDGSIPLESVFCA